VIALTTPYLWYTTRATGLVALILFTMVVTLVPSSPTVSVARLSAASR